MLDSVETDFRDHLDAARGLSRIGSDSVPADRVFIATIHQQTFVGTVSDAEYEHIKRTYGPMRRRIESDADEAFLPPINIDSFDAAKILAVVSGYLRDDFTFFRYDPDTRPRLRIRDLSRVDTMMTSAITYS